MYNSFSKLDRQQAQHSAPKEASVKALPRIEDIDEDEEDYYVDEEDNHKALSGSSGGSSVHPAAAVDEAPEAEMKYVPPPRSAAGAVGGKIDIKFTPRLFPTPMRASKAAEEEDWIVKNRKHLKKHGIFSKNMSRKLL